MEDVKDDLEEKLEPDQLATDEQKKAESEEPAKSKQSST